MPNFVQQNFVQFFKNKVTLDMIEQNWTWPHLGYKVYLTEQGVSIPHQGTRSLYRGMRYLCH